MICYFSELRDNDILDIHPGIGLGLTIAADVDSARGCVLSLPAPERAILLELRAREADYALP